MKYINDECGFQQKLCRHLYWWWGLGVHKRIYLHTGWNDNHWWDQRQDWHLVIKFDNEQHDGHFSKHSWCVKSSNPRMSLSCMYSYIIWFAGQDQRHHGNYLRSHSWGRSWNSHLGCIHLGTDVHTASGPSCPHRVTGRRAQRWAADAKVTAQVQAGSTFLAGSVSPPHLCCSARKRAQMWTSGQGSAPMKVGLQRQAGAMVSQPEYGEYGCLWRGFWMSMDEGTLVSYWRKYLTSRGQPDGSRIMTLVEKAWRPEFDHWNPCKCEKNQLQKADFDLHTYATHTPPHAHKIKWTFRGEKVYL